MSSTDDTWTEALLERIERLSQRMGNLERGLYLAREAGHRQRTEQTQRTHETQNNDTLEHRDCESCSYTTCEACFDVIETYNVHRGPCGHSWCRTCLVNRYEMAVDKTALFPARCCTMDILPDNHWFIDSKTWARYFEKREEVETPNPTFCSKRECSKFIALRNISAGQARCSCGHITCESCKAEWHSGKCGVDLATQAFLEVARSNDWQSCPHCKAVIERIDGCNDIGMPNLFYTPNGIPMKNLLTSFLIRSVQPLRNQSLLCVWRVLEDVSLPSVWAHRRSSLATGRVSCTTSPRCRPTGLCSRSFPSGPDALVHDS